MIFDISYYGDEVLGKKCPPVTEITDEIRQLAKDMAETMYHCSGIGLAAPQIGKSIRLFIVCPDFDRFEHYQRTQEVKVYINPKITPIGEDMEIEAEGCMSIPGVPIKVKRHHRIKIEYMNLDGKTVVEELSGFIARNRMHEVDHLDGILTYDRATDREKKRHEGALRKLKKAILKHRLG